MQVDHRLPFLVSVDGELDGYVFFLGRVVSQVFEMYIHDPRRTIAYTFPEDDLRKLYKSEFKVEICLLGLDMSSSMSSGPTALSTLMPGNSHGKHSDSDAVC